MSEHQDEQNEPVSENQHKQSYDMDACHDMTVIDKTQKENEKSNGPRRSRILLVRYGKMGQVGQFRHSEREIPFGVTHVVVKTERGMEIGEIISPCCYHRGMYKLNDDELQQYFNDSGPNYPVTRNGMVVRYATDNDLKDQEHLNANVHTELKVCKTFVDKLNLQMKMVDAEHLFGGERIIFYFMADGRIDFRDLVKDLAHHYQTRIEMRQIGARDEARLVADFETCGRECCCKNFLKVLQPVNMRMAKLQKATLDPSKISGRCGRLKCCLRYEDEVYTDLNKRLPKKNSCILTEMGHGIVVDAQVLTQLVKVRLAHNDRVVAINVDEILQKNYSPPKDKKAAGPPPSRQRDDEKAETASLSPGDTPEKQDEVLREEDSERDSKGKPRAAKENDEKQQVRGEDDEGETPRKKNSRRRRRRRKKPDSGNKKDGNSNSDDSRDNPNRHTD